MSLTYTPNSELGRKCPDFQLPDVFGKIYALKDFSKSQGLCVMFICNHCPYVKAIEERLLRLAKSFEVAQVQFLGICSNDPSDYPEDRPENLQKRVQEKNYSFPYLVDEDQNVAKNFGAVCTPDLFLFDGDRKLFYRGRLDDSWRDEAQVKQQELKVAIELLLKKQPPPQNTLPSMGCSIKWS